jgi:membrane protein YdbS with pleckstrin-like domain
MLEKLQSTSPKATTLTKLADLVSSTILVFFALLVLITSVLFYLGGNVNSLTTALSLVIAMSYFWLAGISYLKLREDLLLAFVFS